MDLLTGLPPHRHSLENSNQSDKLFSLFPTVIPALPHRHSRESGNTK